MKIKTKKMYKKAFTLAEILVTLAIFGVVFATLAPAVNTFNQEKENRIFRAKTGKAYSVLSEGLRAKYILTQERMVGNSDASNLVDYLVDEDKKIAGTIRVASFTDDGRGFKTQDGMVFAFRGDDCHINACFVVVDMDGQNRGRTKLSVAEMIEDENFEEFKTAGSLAAMDPQNGHPDIVVFMVKDGQVHPYTHYAAENMQMERNQNEAFQTTAISIQTGVLNLIQE
ncbi:prepilin-type N-terminal cleavage/methylation domain-containing protein [bacterium]|nr:prepilin-type N-terminal cleavage/methylation domain-containing protein [bacterium]